ncbi:MAG: helix-turn-helix domain-containing protein [Bacillota bacterium]|jgi:repressor LexA
MEFKNIIRNRRLALGLTLEEVGKRVGVSKATVQRWESGVIENIRRDKISKLAKTLQTTPASLMGWDDGNEDIFIYSDIMSVEKKNFPGPGVRGCGEADINNMDHEGYMQMATAIDADFCLRFKGDSMINARIYDGDIILVHRQATVNDGEVAAVIIDKQPTLRRVYKIGETIQLHAENPAYKPLVLSQANPDIRIIGKAIAFQGLIK